MTKRRKRIEVITPVPAVEVMESEAIILQFDAPLSGSIVIMADMLCGECHRAGVLVVSVRCMSCGSSLARIVCLRSNVEVSHGSILIPDDVVLCEDCRERDDDIAPPIVGGPLRKFDPNRLN